jgi:hypothetical protein
MVHGKIVSNADDFFPGSLPVVAPFSSPRRQQGIPRSLPSCCRAPRLFPLNTRPAAAAYQARVRTKPDLDSVLRPIGSGVELSRKHEQGPRP